MAVLAAILLASLTYHGLHVVWPIYVLAAASSAAGAFDLPARQSLVPNLVPREHLPNAISLNTIMVQVAVGRRPGARRHRHRHGRRGLGLRRQRGVVPRRDRRAADDAGRGRRPDAPGRWPDRRGGAAISASHAALEGLRFVFRSPLIRSTMLLDFFATFFSSATALLPIFAQDMLHVGARGYGWLYAAPAVGAVAGQRDHGARGRPDRTARHRADGRGRGLRRGDRGVRPVARFWLTFCVPGRDRRGRHREHGVPQPDSPARDARRPARPHDRRQHDVLHGRPAARRARGRPASRNGLGPVVSVVSGGIGCLIATAWVAAVTPGLRAYRRTGAAAGAGRRRCRDRLLTREPVSYNPCTLGTLKVVVLYDRWEEPEEAARRPTRRR